MLSGTRAVEIVGCNPGASSNVLVQSSLDIPLAVAIPFDIVLLAETGTHNEQRGLIIIPDTDSKCRTYRAFAVQIWFSENFTGSSMSRIGEFPMSWNMQKRKRWS